MKRIIALTVACMVPNALADQFIRFGGGSGSASGASIGDVITGGTQGSVLFIGPLSTLSQDNAKFFWDDATFRLGLGTASPAATLSVGAGSKFQVDANGNVLKVNNVATSFPGVQGANHTTFHNDGSGNLTWALAALTTDVTGTLPVGNGGTNKTSYTAGSLVFAGAGGTTLTENNANIFWDDTAHRLGVGTATPQEGIEIVGAGFMMGNNQSFQWRDNSGTPRSFLIWNALNQVELRNNALGTGGPILFETMGGAGESMRLTSGGNLGIGVTTPAATLEVNGGIRLNTATVRPACVVGIEGTTWVTQGGAGVTDDYSVCLKSAADTYNWISIVTGG